MRYYKFSANAYLFMYVTHVLMVERSKFFSAIILVFQRIVPLFLTGDHKTHITAIYIRTENIFKILLEINLKFHDHLVLQRKISLNLLAIKKVINKNIFLYLRKIKRFYNVLYEQILKSLHFAKIF